MTTTKRTTKTKFIYNLLREEKVLTAIQLDEKLVHAGYGAYDRRHLTRIGVECVGTTDLGWAKPKLYTLTIAKELELIANK